MLTCMDGEAVVTVIYGAALDKFLLRKQGKHWDGVPVPHVATKDLSKAAIDRFRKLARESQRLGASVLRESAAELIGKLSLFEGGYLKRAAVLLFHPDPAADLGLGTSAIENHLKALRVAGCIRRVGPAKDGRWKVLQ